MIKNLSAEEIDCFIFDFDGVLTDNQVYVDQNGSESVSCSRSDGLAFDVLRILNKQVYIFSTEKNPIVSVRAKKLKIETFQGLNDKLEALESLVLQNKFKYSRVLYVGNDLNDYNAMLKCGIRVAPSDSHKKIINISNIKLQTKGGRGVVRELLEEILELDFIDILYNN